MLTMRAIIFISLVLYTIQKQSLENLSFLSDNQNSNSIDCIALKTFETLNFSVTYNPHMFIDDYEFTFLEIIFNGDYKKDEQKSTDEKFVVNNFEFHLRVAVKNRSSTSVYEISVDVDLIEISNNSTNFGNISLSGYGISDFTDHVTDSLKQIFIDHFENKKQTAIDTCSKN